MSYRDALPTASAGCLNPWTLQSTLVDCSATLSAQVPGDENGNVTQKAFSACTAEDLRKAIQRKRKPASSKPLPPGAEELADLYQEALKSRFPAGVLIKVEVRNQKGEAVLDFKGIPMSQVNKLIEALMELPAMPQVRLVETVSPQA
jgi:hypothetical protein